MSAVLTWIAYGLAALFLIACTVAWWEHLARQQRGPFQAEDERDLFRSPPVQQPRVDVALDLAQGDVADRRRALGQTLARLGEKPAGFGDTVPMVLPGQVPAATAADSRRAERRPAETAGH